MKGEARPLCLNKIKSSGVGPEVMFPLPWERPGLIPALVLCSEDQQQWCRVLQTFRVAILSNDLSDWSQGHGDKPWGDPALLSQAALLGENRGRWQPREKKRAQGSFGGMGVVLRFKKQKAYKTTHPTAIARQDVGNSTTYYLLERKRIFFLNVALSENHVYKISNNVCFVVVGTEHSTPHGALNHFIWMQKPSLLCWIERSPKKPECEKKSNSWKFQPAGSSFPRPVCFGLPLPFLSFFL